MRDPALKELIPSVVKSTASTALEFIQQWHRDDLVAKIEKEKEDHRHKEHMKVLEALQTAEAKGSATDETRRIYVVILNSVDYNHLDDGAPTNRRRRCR